MIESRPGCDGEGVSDQIHRLTAAAIWFACRTAVASGLIGAFHAGVEYGWWEGVTTCSSVSLGDGDPLDAIMNAPIVRCDAVQWSLAGISLAGWNFLISTVSAIAIFVLLGKRPA